MVLLHEQLDQVRLLIRIQHARKRGDTLPVVPIREEVHVGGS